MRLLQILSFKRILRTLVTITIKQGERGSPCLLQADNFRQNKIQTVSQDFSQNHVSNIAKRDKSKITNGGKGAKLRDENQKGTPLGFRNGRGNMETIEKIVEVMLKQRPEVNKKFSYETIWPWAFPSTQIFDSRINFLWGKEAADNGPLLGFHREDRNMKN